MRLGIAGGDQRAVQLAYIAKRAGDDVFTWGLSDAGFTNAAITSAGQPAETFPNAEHAAAPALDALVLPAPWCARDGKLLTPLGAVPPLPELLALLRTGATLVFGGCPCPLQDRLAAQNRTDVHCIDLLTTESYLHPNAALTAEGALCALLTRAPFALFQARCAVLGYGRVGRAVMRRLAGISARTVVFSASRTERAEALCEGFEALPFEQLPACAAELRVVLNTVPAPVLEPDVLARLPREALVVELASAPGGFDLPYAQSLGLLAWSEPSLPGRYCPQDAAKWIYAHCKP